MILREAPPTGGLPLYLNDLFGDRSLNSLNRAIIEITGASDVEVTCSGTAALVIAFTYLKRVSLRRKVIISGYTCPLVAFAALQVGLQVVPCDTIQNGFDLDINHLEILIDNDTLCIVPTHYGGALTNVARIRNIVNNLSSETFIIEDAAQAFGATWNNASVGFAGDIGIFSFAAGKGLTIYEGGCLVSPNAEVMSGLREVSNEIMINNHFQETLRKIQLIQHYLLYNPFGIALTYGVHRRYWLRRNDIVRANSDYFTSDIPLHKVSLWRMSVGARASRRLYSHLARLQEIFEQLGTQLHGLPGLELHEPIHGTQPNCTYRFLTFASAAQCQAALEVLWPSPFGVSKPFIHAIIDHPSLEGKLAASRTPNVLELTTRTIALTTSPFLREVSRQTLVETLRALTTAVSQ
jgi:dTDP-4-amino-4,6-dideoxygalactose transaminase